MYISYRSDLYIAGRTEDGDEITGQAFYAYVELADGTRYAHNKSFCDTAWEDYDFGDLDMGDCPAGCYQRDDGEAEAQCAALVETIKAAGKINVTHWNLVEAAYGSDAYLVEIAGMSQAERGYAVAAQ